MSTGRTSAVRDLRTGFTIAEVLVALVLFTVALLGLAGSSAIAVRDTAASLRERRAVQRGADRVAMLRAVGCAAARSGSAIDPSLGLAEGWIVASQPGGLALIDEQVRWRAAGTPRMLLLRSAILC
jgi:Tfp pilus assembly protein PilV